MEETLHIASLLVHARPELFETVKANLRLLPGLELHQESALGKLVVVIEAPNEQQILLRIEQISSFPGVLNAALVYHEILASEGETL